MPLIKSWVWSAGSVSICFIRWLKNLGTIDLHHIFYFIAAKVLTGHRYGFVVKLNGGPLTGRGLLSCFGRR